MGLEDIACLRALPNIPIVQPADELETKQAVAYAVEHPGPLYLRLTRQNLEAVHDANYRFQFGKADVLRYGRDVSILASGGPVWNALEAARKLAAEGVDAEILNVTTIKPLDEEAILRSAGKTGPRRHRRRSQHPRWARQRGGRVPRRGDADRAQAPGGHDLRRVG